MVKKVKKPPWIAKFLLNRMKKYDREFVSLGDFEEEYNEIQKDNGFFNAYLWYWRQALGSLFSYVKLLFCWRMTMLKNYFKTTLRNIYRHKGYTFINVLGLTLGLTCCLLISIWVLDKLSFDRFHEKVDNLYRIEVDRFDTGKKIHEFYSPSPLAGALTEEIPEIIYATNFTWSGGISYKYKEKIISENNIRAVDPSFFNMFSFPLLRGDKNTVLKEPYSMVVSEKVADKYFGGNDALGKVITVDEKYSFTITGIMENVPHNSFFQMDIVVPFSFAKVLGRYNPNWNYSSSLNFVLLQDNTGKEIIEQKISDFVAGHTGNRETKFILNPISRIHLHTYSGTGEGIRAIQYIYIFTIVSIFVLLIACINYMNLSTARSSSRSREIGMRKVMGAVKGNIISQFFTESVLLTVAAFIFALILSIFLIPAFNTVSGKQFTAGIFLNRKIISTGLLITLFTGFFAGSYPAFFLSGFQPVRIIQGTLSKGSKRPVIRRILVVLQFSVSIILIVCTLVVFRQIDFMKNADLGFNKEQIVVVRLVGNTSYSYETLKSEFSKAPNVYSVSAGMGLPTNLNSKYGDVNWDNKSPNSNVMVGFNAVEYDYIETLGIKISEGRSFSDKFITDRHEAFVINEELVKLMNMDNKSVLGVNFKFMGIEGEIIGVMKNFHHRSFRESIDPYAFFIAPNPEWLRFMIVKIGIGNINSTINFLENSWKKLCPKYEFNFGFLDESFDRIYRTETNMYKLLNYFTILGIFIACLGLFGLASFIAEQRTKEIGIRKTLGASVKNIVVLLSKEFLILVAVSNLLAWPVSYYVMSRWLENFAYFKPQNFSLYIFTGILTIFIALFTVSSQAFKAAGVNPVDSLRRE